MRFNSYVIIASLIFLIIFVMCFIAFFYFISLIPSCSYGSVVCSYYNSVRLGVIKLFIIVMGLLVIAFIATIYYECKVSLRCYS